MNEPASSPRYLAAIARPSRCGSRRGRVARPVRAAIVDGVDRPSSRPHRPALYADLTGYIDAAGGMVPSSRAEVAAATAAVLVQAGRDADEAGEAQFVALGDHVGIETLGALWRGSDPVSLPGALWALYLLRQWWQTNAEHVSLLWRAGAPLAAADAAVAGVADPGDCTALRAAADAILAGVYRGDLAVALERAAAAFRVLATGRRELAEGVFDPQQRGEEFGLADRNDRAAADLSAAAGHWRAGTLG
jgi:hypothetical protein